MKFLAQITRILQRTSSATSYRFKKPTELFYKPGQYMLVTLNVAGKEVMHQFSFSSSPTEGIIEFTKKFTESDYSTALKNLHVGDKMQIDAPYGQFTFTGEHSKICLLAGGIGVTPFISICKYCTDVKIPSSIIMLYNCHSENEIAFHKELKKMQTKNPNMKVLFILNQHRSDWKGITGSINTELIKNQIKDYRERAFFACGPPGMINSMQSIIAELGLPKTQLKLEALSGHNYP